MKRHVMYVTGTRADFGLMVSTLRAIHAHPSLRVSIVMTGMHLDPDFGATAQEVRATGLPIVGELPTPVGERTGLAMAHAVGYATAGLADVMVRERPDVVLLLGDRGEMLAGAIAALHIGIPIAHIHGGDRSGTVDEPIRHAITKLSHFHFVATEESKQRVIRMGEREEFVWVTGAPSLDGITDGLPENHDEVCRQLGLEKADPYVLVLFHPVVAEAKDAFRQTQELIAALSDITIIGGRCVIWLDPNADAGSGDILNAISAVRVGAWHRITHLTRATYLAALKHCDVLIGNSSSGIVEAASFGTPVVNIGSRQNLRQRNLNTIDCAAQREDIKSAIVRALERGRLPAMNVYGNGKAGCAIVELLTKVPVGRDAPEKFNTY